MERLYRLESPLGLGGMYMPTSDVPFVFTYWHENHVLKDGAWHKTHYSLDKAAMSEVIGLNFFGDRDWANSMNDDRPLPEDDGIDISKIERGRHKFAFNSLEQLGQWMDNVPVQELIREGCVFRVMDVKRILLQGNRQVAYDEADVVRSFSIHGAVTATLRQHLKDHRS